MLTDTKTKKIFLNLLLNPQLWIFLIYKNMLVGDFNCMDKAIEGLNHCSMEFSI